MRNAWDLIKTTIKEWQEDKAARLGAALAYYTIFSLAPLLVIAIAVAGLVFGQEAAQGQIMNQIAGLIGPQNAQLLQTMIQNASQPGTSIVATVLGLATLLLGATGVFGQLQDALNTMWEVQPKPGRGLLGLIKDRFLSFAMVLGTGFLLLVSLVLSAALAALGTFVGGLLPAPGLVLEVINFIVSFGTITLLFAAIYKLLPDVKIAWRDVWIGAVVTALLFTIGRTLIGVYIGRTSTASTYGAAGALVVILLWTYYSAQILFLGAEFTQVYANRYGSRVQPARGAVPVTEEARAQQGVPHREEVGQAAHAQPVTTRGERGAGALRPATLPARPTAGYGAVRALLGLIALTGFVGGVLTGVWGRAFGGGAHKK